MSAMEGITSPTMMSGIRNFRKEENAALKVVNTATAHSGISLPSITPSEMATTTRSSNGIFGLLESVMVRIFLIA